MSARLFTDGGSRGNPGPAAYGYVIEDQDGTVLAANGVNQQSLLKGQLTRKAVELGVDELEVVSDSELMVRQMTGVYRIKNEALRRLSLDAANAARKVGQVTYRSVRREHNKLADKLVNEALDSVLKR